MGGPLVEGVVEMDYRRIVVDGSTLGTVKKKPMSKKDTFGWIHLNDGTEWLMSRREADPADPGVLDVDFVVAAFPHVITVEDESGVVLATSQRPSDDALASFTTDIWATLEKEDADAFEALELPVAGTKEAMEQVIHSDWQIGEIATPVETFTFRQNIDVSFPELVVDDATSGRDQKRARRKWQRDKDAYFSETVVATLALEVISNGERVALGGNQSFAVTQATPLEVILLAHNEIAIAAAVAAIS